MGDSDKLARSEATVEIDGVSKVFASDNRGIVHALDGLTFAIAAGRFVSVVGPSGCGKSTLLNLIAGLDQPTVGQIRINETIVSRPYHDLGIVFQRDLLLDWRNILKNVLIQIEMRGGRVSQYEGIARDLLTLVGIGEFWDRHPRELSGGMRQRAAICRALVHDPALLLMDEPFGALDALTREQLNIDLLHICARSETTVCFITHSIAEAVFLSDTVIVMSSRPGRIIQTVEVQEPRPRRPDFRLTSSFSAYVRSIRRAFEEEGVLRAGA